MNLCESGHQEVCFEGKTCPVCQILKDMEKPDARIEELKQEILNHE